MQPSIYTLDFENQTSSDYATPLESGQVLYAPKLGFALTSAELSLLTPSVCDTKKKNISYHVEKQQIGGISRQNPHQVLVQTMVHRYALYAKTVIDTVLPTYQSQVRWGRTSYRPVEINDRHCSKRQDDRRIHVDAFPATPVQGSRILRVFCNINPEGKPRVWNLGEPFTEVLSQFVSRFSPYSPFKAQLLHRIKATKLLRTAYDHYMLQLHDLMKLDDRYQANFKKTNMDFAANSTWIAFTDHVSHAALSGQYLLEQTFYLPVSGMQFPEYSPLRHIEAQGLFPATNQR